MGIVIGLASIAAVATRLLSARAIDRRGRRPFALGGLALFATATALLPLAASLGALLALRAVQGVGWGLATTAIASLVADLAPAARRGEAIGIWGLAPTVAMALGPAAGGGLVRLGGAPAAFLGTAALFLVALGLVVPIAEPRHAASASGKASFPRGAAASVRAFSSSPRSPTGRSSRSSRWSWAPDRAGPGRISASTPSPSSSSGRSRDGFPTGTGGGRSSSRVFSSGPSASR